MLCIESFIKAIYTCIIKTKKEILTVNLKVSIRNLKLKCDCNFIRKYDVNSI